MGTFEDRLSRVAALRPKPGTAGPAPKEDRASNADELLRLLDGEIVRNSLGSHICVRRRFADPEPVRLPLRAAQLLVPHAPDAMLDPEQWLFLDTETTGLSGGTGTYAFLVGLGWWEADGFVVAQYFMRDHGEERSLLMEVAAQLARRRVLVTFNGKSFDWPLLTTRFQMTRTDGIREPAAHLDLLHPARRLWRLHLRSVALTELERHVLGFDRGPDIPSETIPHRYFAFLRGGSAGAIAEIFQHNQQDLCGLAWLARHVGGILGNPEHGCCGAAERFGVSRLLQSRGESQLAGRMYQRSLEEGLPEAAARVARRELALMARRNRDYERSSMFWEMLLGDSVEGLKAYEQLAMYYEHHDVQLQKAAGLTREALGRMQEAFRSGRLPAHRYQKLHASFQHRLARLAAKIGIP